MKKLILISSIQLGSLISLAAPVSIYQQILSDKNLKEKNIVSIAQTQTFRCPGCFRFEVMAIDKAGMENVLTYQSQGDFKKNKLVITVKLAE